MTESNGSSLFKVVLPGTLKRQILRLHLQARKHGLDTEFLDALAKIHRRLERDPRQFGDPQYHLQALKLTIFVRAVYPVAVDYGVHDKLPFVIVRGLRLMI